MPKVPIKTADEIEIMRKGGRILQNVLDAIEKKIETGMTTLELDVFAEDLIRKSNATPSFKGYQNFPATLCISINEEVVHGIPNSRVIKNGDIVGVDCGVCYKKLHTDSARTFIIGEVSDEVKFFVKTTKKALQKSISKVREGVRLGDVSAAIQKTVEQRGFSVVRNCTGHGIGYTVHEPPEILNYGKKGKGIVLRSGMVLAIEPISVMGPSGDTYDESDGWTVKAGNLSAHFEHTVLVTKNGCEILA